VVVVVERQQATVSLVVQAVVRLVVVIALSVMVVPQRLL
jgi:hypothetical protein